MFVPDNMVEGESLLQQLAAQGPARRHAQITEQGQALLAVREKSVQLMPERRMLHLMQEALLGMQQYGTGNDCDTTLADAWLQQQLGTISPLADFKGGITTHHAPAWQALNQAKAAQDLQEIQQSYGPHCLALDESAFFFNHVQGYARSKRGTRAIITQPGVRGKAHSLLLCISPDGVVFWQLYQGAVTAQRFIGFMLELPKETTLVLDNAKIHHATNVLKALDLPTVPDMANFQDITMKYLPAYAPQLNPVELCFNIIKTFVKRERPRTALQLHASVEAAVLTLTPEVCRATWAKVFQV